MKDPQLIPELSPRTYKSRYKKEIKHIKDSTVQQISMMKKFKNETYYALKEQNHFKPRTGHIWDKPSSACGCVRYFFPGILPFSPNLDMSEIILKRT